MSRALLLAFLASLTFARGAAASNCTPARMLMVVDKSSSMTATVDGTGKSKWQLATEAITDVASNYESKIDLGINIFPNPSQCAPGKTLVEPGPGNAAAIIAALGGPPPSTGNYTPMSQSIDVAADDALLADPSRRPAILLVTDGWQWCSPYDPATRTWPVDSVLAAKAKGIKVYVVGFGDSVDVQTMNQMAYAAGTALPGCNPSSTSTTGNNCYYQADSGVDLSAALNAISITVSAEICNGLDDDCDGLIDEDLTQACSSACGAGVEICTAGTWSACDAPKPKAEICDLIDNDCDGLVDEGCACTPGSTTSCGIVGIGACAQQGTQTCMPNGQWGPCTGAGTPSPEICNGIDDDCNGLIDDGDPGQLCGAGQFCGANSTCQDKTNETYSTPCEGQSGGCSNGPTTGPTSTPSACPAGATPGIEKCNGVDDDCDGIIDNEDAANLCPTGWVCGGDGRCHNDGGTTEVTGCAVTPTPVERGGMLLVLWSFTALVLVARRRFARR